MQSSTSYPPRLAGRLSLFPVTMALLLFASAVPGQSPAKQGLAQLHREFANPPDSSRIMMRWWWFGPAAEKSEITRELEQMKSAGIGGVEIANLYPLALDDPATGFHNTPYLSAEHLDALRFAATEGRRLGLRVDITLGSGWPFGGPSIPVTQAASKLRIESVAIPPGSASAQVPFIDVGESLINAFLLPDPATPDSVSQASPIAAPSAGRYSFTASDQPRRLFVFVSSRTGMMVKRPSVGAEGFVLDHYDRAAIENHLHAVGDKLLSAFGDKPPYAVFSDSLEDYASDWSPALLREFQERRGYDLRPHLLALVMDAGPETAAIRHDWGETLTELADDNFLKPIHAWAAEHHTLFRSQSYGYPPVTLSSNRFEDLPEGEGKATIEMGRQFSDTRWAASAGHLFHHDVISSETWTWLHSPAFRATPLDMKAEADLHFLQGINQLVGHGWPYSPASQPEPGWRMYAAASFDAHNPWFFAMPDVTRYLQRVSFALRQGQPANDVALLLPNDDVWASFKANLHHAASPTSAAGFDESGSNVSVDEDMPRFLGRDVIPQILDAGFNLDFIDADAIDTVGIPYKVLVLPNVDRIPVETYVKILAFARAGGIVIATRRLPGSAPGFEHSPEESAQIDKISQALFHGSIATAHFIQDEPQLGAALASATPPDMRLDTGVSKVGFIHRKLPDGDLYFVANTSNAAVETHAQFRATAQHVESWDPFTGKVTGLPDTHSIDLDLAPYESRLIFFSDDAAPGKPDPHRTETNAADLSHHWTVSFGNAPATTQIEDLKSWADAPKTRYFSGHAAYRRSFSIAHLTAESQYLLDFGTATALQLPDPQKRPNMLAYLDPPVREAALVFVNEKRAGVVWRPPYRIDITPFLHPGENNLRIVVGNTALNEMAGRALPDYRLLWARYGMRFVPQGMEEVKPIPSGLPGPVTLVESRIEH